MWERWILVGGKAIVDKSVCSSLKWFKYGFTRALSPDGKEHATHSLQGTFGSFLAIWTEGAGGAALQARLECAQEALTKWSKYGFTRAFSSDGKEHATHSLQNNV